MIRAILFDKDGTLIDFEKTYAPATERVLLTLSKGDRALAERMGQSAGFDLASLRFSPASVIIAGTARDMAALYMPLLGHDDQDALTSEIDALYLEHSRACVQLFGDTYSALQALEGYPLGIATNDCEAGGRDHAHEAGIAGFFTFYAGHDSGHGEKPGPGMVLAFAEATGFEPGEIAMVGDSVNDMRAGRTAGAISIGLTSGMADHDTLAPHADHVLPGIGSLPDLVAMLNG